MNIDECPPPFDGTVDDGALNSLSFNQSISIDNSDDEESVQPSHIDNENRKSDDVSTMQSFSNSSVFEKENTLNTADDCVPESAVKPVHLSEDDDEWGDFDSAPVAQEKTSNAKNDDFDDWGAFDQGRPSMDSENGSTNVKANKFTHQQSLEEWGEFETQGENDANFDEWEAEFTSAPSVSKTIVSEPITDLKLIDEILNDSDFWEDGFDNGDDVENSGIFSENLDVDEITSIFNNENLSEEYISEDEARRGFARLWLSLRVVEEALSLKFEWKDSTTRIKHFEALKIDPNRVPKSRKQALDIASVLLPTQPQSNSTTEANEETSSKHNSASSTESPSIPVVDFDWDTSGLTNPLKGASQSSAVLDVDFFSTNGVATSYTDPLKKDLAEFGLNSSSEIRDNTPSLLNSILSKSSNGRKSPFKDSNVVSLDARNLLDQLPDIEYLQSSMLMFPMGSWNSEMQK